ncbi:hypothetical protein HaLaN_03433 [Haematococcus lacustris]|uniref:Uncharacterized protein n=1 Tax=Haematococcus lacustris TaxID=44745 RepID=A0A699YGX5_HAELA|nr:hypothetical protein HaLaN_03433 [Haematococcus lacustris]
MRHHSGKVHASSGRSHISALPFPPPTPAEGVHHVWHLFSGCKNKAPSSRPCPSHPLTSSSLHVLPLGLYGSQVWGTALLDMVCSSPTQCKHACSAFSGLMVLHELGQLPLQLYWLGAACKFWNTAKLSHNHLLLRVIKADVELGRSCQAKWSAQFQLAARELMGGEFTLSPDMVIGTKALEVKWLESWGRHWAGFEGDPRLPETVHRERCSYAAWLKHGDGVGINHMAPHLLNRQLSTEVRTSLTRFSEGVTFIDCTCTRCTEGVVDDAMHFIFECTATRSSGSSHVMSFQNNNVNLHDFISSPCAPLKSRTPRGGGRPSSLTADGLSGVSHIIESGGVQGCRAVPTISSETAHPRPENRGLLQHSELLTAAMRACLCSNVYCPPLGVVGY